MVVYEVPQESSKDMVKGNCAMTKSPKISVIIPVYNTERYLPRCLDSVLSNTHKNFRVICVNDGSIDNSINILDNYKASDERVIVINQENSGVSAARNAGLNVATGEYIAFIDSDDWVHPQYFEILLFAMSCKDSDVAACQYSQVSEESDDLIKPLTYKKEDIFCTTVAEAIRDNYIKRAVWGRLYKRALVSGKFETGLTWGEDAVFNYCTLATNALSAPFSRTKLPLYFYFSRETSITNTVSSKRYLELAKWYPENWSNERFSKEVQTVLLEQAAKELLIFRYREAFSTNPTCVDELIKRCRAYIAKAGILPLKKRALYSLMFACPPLYRLFRIVNDPTMLQWEKQARSECQS